MKKGKATPEPERGPKLTMVVKTRTPLEAFKILRMGQPVDQALGFYTQEYQGKDLHLMDDIEKLHLLAYYRGVVNDKNEEYQKQLTILNNLKNEQASQSSEPPRPEGVGGSVPK